MPPQDESYKGMSPRDMLVLIYERLEQMSHHNDANEKRIDALEKKVLQFETQIRMIVVGASATATILSIVISLGLK
jgi:hypothetical protein